MKEEILHQFFDQELNASELQAILQQEQTEGEAHYHYEFRDMDAIYLLERYHLLALCEAVLQGLLAPILLQPIGALISQSEKFEWDDEVITEVCYCWWQPEETRPLDIAAVELYQGWLTGEIEMVQE